MRVGADVNRVTMVVRQSAKSDCVIVWDTENDVEMEAFDRSAKCEVIFDEKGNSYVMDEDIFTVCKQGV